MWSVKIVLTPQPSLFTQTCLLEKIANLGAKLIRVNQNVFILNFPSPYMRWCSVMSPDTDQLSNIYITATWSLIPENTSTLKYFVSAGMKYFLEDKMVAENDVVSGLRWETRDNIEMRSSHSTTCHEFCKKYFKQTNKDQNIILWGSVFSLCW